MLDSAMLLDELTPGSTAMSGEKRPERISCQTVYLRIPTMGSREDNKTRAIVQMFPGTTKTVLFYADTRKMVGTGCLVEDLMVEELRTLLGEENVVLK